MRFALVSLSLSASLVAQGLVPPHVLTTVNPHPGLSAPAIPGTAIEQVHMIHLPSDPPNVFHCAMTVRTLPASLGGVGSADLVTGKYDALADTFTPDADAAALNTSGYEFGLTLHHSGLYATFDDITNLRPMFARRASLSAPWQLVGPITPIAAQSYYDPVLVDYKGTTHLIYVLGSDLAMTPIDLNTGTLNGPTTVIVYSATAGSTANSPTPILDSNGEIIGLSHHDLVSSDNDHYLSLDLDPNTPSILLNDTTTWTNNGAVVGGRFIDAEYTPSPYHTLSIDTYWFTGGRAAVGKTMELRAFVPPTSSTTTWLTYVLVGGSFSPPQTIPGIGGQLGIALIGLPGFPMPPHDNRNGEAMLPLPIPGDPALSGLVLAAQTVTIDTSSGQLTLANTAALTID